MMMLRNMVWFLVGFGLVLLLVPSLARGDQVTGSCWVDWYYMSMHAAAVILLVVLVVLVIVSQAVTVIERRHGEEDGG